MPLPGAFLEPPYYGTTSVLAVFDHRLPVISDGDADILHYDGEWNGSGARHNYDEHQGIDYSLFYERVRAAAPGNVERAQWAAPDHRQSAGLYIKISHPNSFYTLYAHLSGVRVQQGDLLPAGMDEFQRVIGFSGNSGQCRGAGGTGPGGQCTLQDPLTCGAHLHFQLDYQDLPVDPYGWRAPFSDPWATYDPDGDGRPDGMPSENRWLFYPMIENHDIYPSDAPLVFPDFSEERPGTITIDDGDSGFVTSLPDGWVRINGTGWNNDYLYQRVPGGTGYAYWVFPTSAITRKYHVFFHFPNSNAAGEPRRATVDAAQYTIRHSVEGMPDSFKKEELVVLGQGVYPNNYHPSPWVYVGTYYFRSGDENLDYVKLSAVASGSDGILAADAVRFVPVVYSLYLPVVLRQRVVIPAAPHLQPVELGSMGKDFFVRWTAVFGADGYRLEEAIDPDFSNVTVFTLTGTSLLFQNRGPGLYYYRVRAWNDFSSGNWSNTESFTLPVMPGPYQFEFQDFETEELGRNWLFYSNHFPSNYLRRGCRNFTGHYGAWMSGSVDSAGAPAICGTPYLSSTFSFLVYGPFSLRDAISGYFAFAYWADITDTNDSLFYGVGLDPFNFYGYTISEGTADWQIARLYFDDVPDLGSVLGSDYVWVTIQFKSDSEGGATEGVYVDPVSLNACWQEPCYVQKTDFPRNPDVFFE